MICRIVGRVSQKLHTRLEDLSNSFVKGPGIEVSTEVPSPPRVSKRRDC